MDLPSPVEAPVTNATECMRIYPQEEKTMRSNLRPLTRAGQWDG